MEKKYKDFFYYHDLLMLVIDREAEAFVERIKPNTTELKDMEIEQLYLLPLEMQRKYLIKRIEEIIYG